VREAALQRLDRSPWVIDSRKLLVAPDLSTVVAPGARRDEAPTGPSGPSAPPGAVSPGTTSGAATGSSADGEMRGGVLRALELSTFPLRDSPPASLASCGCRAAVLVQGPGRGRGLGLACLQPLLALQCPLVPCVCATTPSCVDPGTTRASGTRWHPAMRPRPRQPLSAAGCLWRATPPVCQRWHPPPHEPPTGLRKAQREEQRTALLEHSNVVSRMFNSAMAALSCIL
jgi:hypothetical protein